MFAAQTDHEKSIRFIDPSGDEREVRKPLGANDDGRFVEDMSLIVLTQT